MEDVVIASKKFGAAFLGRGAAPIALPADAGCEPVEGLVDCSAAEADNSATDFDGWEDASCDEVS